MVKATKHKTTKGDSGDKTAKPKAADDFITVAKRLGCDEDKAAFESKLARIAKAKVKT